MIPLSPSPNSGQVRLLSSLAEVSEQQVIREPFQQGELDEKIRDAPVQATPGNVVRLRG